jgi:tryptophan 2,3-dioxygenase
MAQKLISLGQFTDELREEFRMLDTCLNVNWRLSHYRSAVRYLAKSESGSDAPATGGTNWQKFLPPRFQKIVSFPGLWSEEELQNWGKGWVEEQLTR